MKMIYVLMAQSEPHGDSWPVRGYEYEQAAEREAARRNKIVQDFQEANEAWTRAINQACPFEKGATFEETRERARDNMKLRVTWTEKNPPPVFPVDEEGMIETAASFHVEELPFEEEP